MAGERKDDGYTDEDSFSDFVLRMAIMNKKLAIKASVRPMAENISAYGRSTVIRSLPVEDARVFTADFVFSVAIPMFSTGGRTKVPGKNKSDRCLLAEFDLIQ